METGPTIAKSTGGHVVAQSELDLMNSAILDKADVQGRSELEF